MAEPGQKRKLSAILSADVVGYSRLMQDDDAATVETLTRYRAVFSGLVTRHEGRIVDSPGDNILAEFDSPVEAVHCAVELQREFARRNRQLAPHRQMQFRIGINLGDILSRDDGTIYGDGVNVAARLESLAEPGGIMISESVRMQVHSLIDVSIADAGKHEVKNIAEPVHVHRIVLDESAPKPQEARKVPRAMIATAAIILLLIAVVIGLQSRNSGNLDDPVLALPEGPVIAVLPFDNLSGEPEQEYFSDGLSEDLITGLSRFPDLFVIGRNTTFQFKGRAVSVQEIARQLGARYVIEGSVRRGGNTIRVNAQLLDSSTGSHLWADTFDRELNATEIFALQDEITAQIIGAIAGSYGVIARNQLESAKTGGTDNLEAYECVLQSYAYEQVLTPDVHAAVRDCLERAVELDPTYADAWSKLAFMYADEHAFGYNPRPGSLDRALAAAQRAVELEPSSQMTHWHLARTHFWRNEVDAAVTEADRALALNPNNAFVLAAAGAYMAPTNPENRKRGAALADKAMLIDPNPPGWYHVANIMWRYQNRDYESALRASLKMNLPGFYQTHMWRLMIYGQLGRTADAEQTTAKLLALYPPFPEYARYELKKLNFDPAMSEHIVEGWRKAGLDVADEPAA